jgi:hypothetical protein
MKKLSLLLCISCVSFHAGTTIAMMEHLNKALRSTYQKYFKRTPAPYTFYAPRDSYSYFSPHFNMYHYVGMDYTNKPVITATMIKNNLENGIRGFKFKISRSINLVAYVGNTDSTGEDLRVLIKDIAAFAEKNNEIIVIHIINTAKYQNIITENIKDFTDINLLFTPSDRLKDIDKNAAKNRIVSAAKKDAITIWPRLTWNYANKKLVMITCDSPEDSKYCWSYDKYFTDNLSDSKKLIETTVDSVSAAMPVAANDQPTIFYSDVLKAEFITGLGTITALAALMIYNYLTEPRIHTHTVWEKPPTDNQNGWDYYKNTDAIPKEDSGLFLKAYQRAIELAESSYSPLQVKALAMTKVTREQIKDLIVLGESSQSSSPVHKVFFELLGQYFNTPYVYVKTIVTPPSWYTKLIGSFIASMATSLTALGVYSIGLTKSAFTVVRKETIPADMAVTGVFLSKPLTQADIKTIRDKNSIFNAVSQLNRDDYTMINNLQRSFLMKIAHHGRRVTSPITNRLRKKR